MNIDDFRLAQEYGEFLGMVRNCDLPCYLALVLRVARVGEVSVEERALALPLAHDLQATDEDRLEALRLADGRTALRELAARLEHPAVRLCCYRDACRMALADATLEAPEVACLDELADSLGLSREQAGAVLGDLIAIGRCQQRFRALLGG